MAPVQIGMRFPVAILFTSSLMITLAAVSVCLRLWARILRKVSLQSNDYMIVFSWLVNFGLAICCNFAVTRGGAGQHQQDVGLSEIVFSLKMFVAFGVLGSLAVSAVKISALDLFNHIFPNKTFHRVSYLVMGMLASYGIAFAIVSLASCKPFAFNWDKEIASGTCIDTSRFYVSQAILGVVFDVVVVALPMPMLWGLQMKIQKKVALTCIFGVGLLICIISIFRAVLNNDVGLQQSDFPYYAGIALILATFENNLSIICASLPVMQPVLKNLTRIIKSTFSRSFGTHNTTSRLWSPPSSSAAAAAAKGKRNPGFGGSAEAKFNRLHDHLYPLASTHQLSYDGTNTTTTTGTGTQNTAERAGSADAVVVEMDDLQREATQPHSAIAVTRAWEVSSKASMV